VGARALDVHAIKTAILASLAQFAQTSDRMPARRVPATSEPAPADPADAGSVRLRARIFEVERYELSSALERAWGNKSLAAKLLRVSRKTLYARLRRHGLGLGEADDAETGTSMDRPGATTAPSPQPPSVPRA
jgi:transcriptional regulator of acetoin/glycerol metabolism